MRRDQIRVRVNRYEVRMAATIGVERQIEALVARRQDKHGFDGCGWDIHIEGAIGELILAKGLGVFWTGTVNTFRSGGDVLHYQVRTRSKPEYELPVRPDDDPEKIFVLVRGHGYAYDIVGWIKGADARRDEWVQTYGGRPKAWFVPDDALHSAEELRSR